MELLCPPCSGHSDRVWHVAWHPSGTLLATCSGDKTVRLWGPASATSSASFAQTAHSSSGGSSVASASAAVAADSTPSSQRWICRAILEDAHKRTVRRVEWSPDGKLLACASFDATVSIWESANGEFDCVATLEGHENEVKCVAWDSGGTMLATCSRDKSAWIWATDGENEFECVSILQGHTQDVKVVRWHPHEPLLVSGSYDDTIRLWREAGGGAANDDDEWESVQTLAGHTSTVWDVAFDASGQRLVSCSDDLTLRVWQPAGGKWACVCTLQGYHTRTIFSVDVSANGLIATGSGDNHVRIFAPDTEVLPPDGPSFRLLIDNATDHPSDVNCVRWNPRDASILATACDDGALRLFRCISTR